MRFFQSMWTIILQLWRYHAFKMNEVLKAAIILSTYHGMCGLCDGMGLLPDADIVNEII